MLDLLISSLLSASPFQVSSKCLINIEHVKVVTLFSYPCFECMHVKSQSKKYLSRISERFPRLSSPELFKVDQMVKGWFEERNTNMLICLILVTFSFTVLHIFYKRKN